VSVRALTALTDDQRDAVLVAMLAAALDADRVADGRSAQVTPPVVV
jgi:hypothetical protein